MAIVELSDMVVAVGVRPGSDFITLDVEAFGKEGSKAFLDLADILLITTDDRISLRRLGADEAANEILGRIKDPPRYKPKYVIEARPDGTVIVAPDPGSPTEAFADGFSESFVRSGNAYMRQRAADIYRAGLGELSPVPADAGIRGAVYFVPPPINPSGYLVRVGDQEVLFRRR